MPHQSRTYNLLLRRLSVVRILPRAAVQMKKFNLDGARDLPFLDLSTIVGATDNFAINKKLGEGGFESVYKLGEVGYL
jgi:hypothetical protein